MKLLALQDWATNFGSEVLNDPLAKEAYDKAIIELTTLINIASSKFNTAKILTLTSAITKALMGLK